MTLSLVRGNTITVEISLADSRENSWIPTSEIIENLCDYNIYDKKGRIVEEHKAGENGRSCNIYDDHNRLIMRKNVNESDWTWIHYDRLDRAIETGTIALAAGTYSREIIQSWFDNSLLPSSFNVS